MSATAMLTISTTDLQKAIDACTAINYTGEIIIVVDAGTVYVRDHQMFLITKFTQNQPA